MSNTENSLELMRSNAEILKQQLSSLESEVRNRSIENLSYYEIAFVNPKWIEDAYDLIVKYKDQNQEVTQEVVRFSSKQSIDLEHYARYGYDEYENRISYFLSLNDEIYKFRTEKDIFGNEYIPSSGFYHHIPSVGITQVIGIFFLELDECIDQRESDVSKDSISVTHYSDIPMYVIRRK